MKYIKPRAAIAALIALSLFAALLSGCTNDNASSSNSPTNNAPGLTPIKVSEFRNMSWIAGYIAEAKGFYEEEGLAVEYVMYSDGPLAFQGMHSGDSDFCLLSQEPVLKAQEEGLQSNIIYTVLDTRLYGFVGNAHVKEVSDLKGATIFAGMQGSAPYSFVCSILREAGIDPEKDVTFVNMDYGASMAALDQGQIQASYINNDNRVEMQDLDVNILVDTAEKADAKKYLDADVFPGEIITTTKAFAENNPETVQKFVNAISKATEWMNESSSEEIAEALAPYFEGIEKEVLTKKVEIFKPALTKTGYIDEASEQAVIQFVVNGGTIEGTTPYDDIINMAFVDAYQALKVD